MRKVNINIHHMRKFGEVHKKTYMILVNLTKKSVIMKKFNRKFVSIIISLIMIIGTVNTIAHPGRTDSNGGHWDRKNGTYHFHDGSSAGKSSSGSSSHSEYVPFTPPYDPPTENPYRQKKDDEKEDEPFYITLLKGLGIYLSYWGICVLIFAGIPALIGGAINGFKYLLNKPLANFKIYAFDKTLDKYIEYKHKVAEMRKELLIMRYKVKKQMAERFEVGDDGLPKEWAAHKWGRSFTLFKTRNGTKFHTEPGCSSADIAINIWECLQKRDFKQHLCRKCASFYTPPNLEWYKQYLEWKDKANDYTTLLINEKKLKNKLVERHKDKNSFPLLRILSLFNKKAKIRLTELDRLFSLDRIK